MQKTYLSRAMTRAMALDHPIGDPTGGPAYGEKNDPISAVISIASMAGTYAAAGTFAAMTLTQGLVFAGAALSLAGNVTGNKTLSKIGMVTGLAGGVGMLAEWATGSTIGGTLGETFGFGGEAAATGAEAAALAQTPTGAPQTPAAAVAESYAVPTPSVEASPLGPVGGESLAAPSLNAPGGAAAPLNAPGGAAAPLNAGAISNTAMPGQPGYGWEYFGETAGNVPTAISPEGQYFANVGGTGMEKITGAGGQPLSFGEKAWDAAKSVGSGAMDLAKSNPGAAMMMGNAASGVADWLSGKTDAEIAALEAQVGFADARALQIQEEIARERQRRANLNAGYTQVNTSMQINPNANIPQPWQQQQPAGLIAGARVPTGG